MLTKKQTEKIRDTVDKLLSNAQSRLSKYDIQHTNFGPVHVYFGAGNYVRMYPLAPNGSIVVASVDVEEKKQGKGYFKSFFNEVEALAESKNMRVIFESVVNNQLEEWLKTKGYELYQGGSYYKDVKEYNIKKEKDVLNDVLNATPVNQLKR